MKKLLLGVIAAGFVLATVSCGTMDRSSPAASSGEQLDQMTGLHPYYADQG